MKTNKYLIFIARKFWFWLWMKLMDGFAPSDKYGNYKRPKGLKSKYKLEENLINNKNLYLLVGATCPWCHRLLIQLSLQNLSKKINIIFLIPNYEMGEWSFNKIFLKNNTLEDLYKKIYPNKVFRPTLPLLISSESNNVELISNESSEIIKIFNCCKDDSIEGLKSIKTCSEDLLELINNDINNGVYKCGFARNQNAYIKSSNKLFKALHKIEKTLEVNGGPWILGQEITTADIYLFPTMIRWELIYNKLFKCTEKDIEEFRNIVLWRYKFFNIKGISDTCFDKEWVRDYYQAIFPLNPNQIVPLERSLDEIINLKTF